MTGLAGPAFYRKVSRKLRQGDIAYAEFTHLRAASDRPGPGERLADETLPYFGPPQTFEIALNSVPGGRPIKRFLWVWQGPVMVLHQNCEIDWASPDDSRLVVAPIVVRGNWEGEHWKVLATGHKPGFIYLPDLSATDAAAMDVPSPMSEGAVALASACVVGREVVRTRAVGLTQTALRDVQDGISRFFGVRGFASEEVLANLVGKRVVSVDDAGQTIDGPSRLVKVLFGDEPGADPDEADDEASIAYFGVRRVRQRDVGR